MPARHQAGRSCDLYVDRPSRNQSPPNTATALRSTSTASNRSSSRSWWRGWTCSATVGDGGADQHRGNGQR
ncbi:unnamed protein product [Closterium sp. NIES-53]